MNITDIIILQNPQNPADYNVKADIYDDANIKIGDFGTDGVDVFSWWAKQDEAFRLNIINQFISIIANEIVSGKAE
jgi:hypothetical protein